MILGVGSLQLLIRCLQGPVKCQRGTVIFCWVAKDRTRHVFALLVCLGIGEMAQDRIGEMIGEIKMTRDWGLPIAA